MLTTFPDIPEPCDTMSRYDRRSITRFWGGSNNLRRIKQSVDRMSDEPTDDQYFTLYCTFHIIQDPNYVSEFTLCHSPTFANHVIIIM